MVEVKVTYESHDEKGTQERREELSKRDEKDLLVEVLIAISEIKSKLEGVPGNLDEILNDLQTFTDVDFPTSVEGLENRLESLEEKLENTDL